MSVPHFHSLQIKDIRKETYSCVSISFHIPPELKEDFRYKAGQYITIKKKMKGEEVRRSYSLCSSPLENDFRIAVKQIDGGMFSTFANQNLTPGETLEVMCPMGNFSFDFAPNQTHHYVAFTAGSGITPILSLIKTALATEAHSTFTLVYGNQYVQSVIFKEEIEALKNKFMNRFQVVHILSRERMESDLNYGRIDASKCEQLWNSLLTHSNPDQFFLCGPEEMIQHVKDFLLAKNIPSSAIHFELFTSNTSTEKKTAYKEAHKADAGKMCKLTIKVDDRSFDLDLPYDGDTILDAALKHGADLPFACKGGVCCTCRAKVMEGSVDMEVNYALEEEEVNQGFVLTCQAHPTSDRVIVDFDQR